MSEKRYTLEAASTQMNNAGSTELLDIAKVVKAYIESKEGIDTTDSIYPLALRYQSLMKIFNDTPMDDLSINPEDIIEFASLHNLFMQTIGYDRNENK